VSAYTQLLSDLERCSGMRLGLDGPRRLLAALGNPQMRMQHIHVAGTNGKGSVCWKMARALQLAGRKVGLYTSPHISSTRERIRIQGELCSEEQFVRVGRQVLAVGDRATYFELLTAMAFLLFAQEGVEVAVVEVGLGGRLDATNCIDPMLTVITSIGLDHMDELGTDLDAIASEKAGIIKPNVPLVIGTGARRPPILLKAQQLHEAPPTHGDFDAENSAIARTALEVIGIAAPAEALQVRPPCRMERIGPALLDVAHNPHGLAALRRSIPPPEHLIMGLSASKDLVGCFKAIKGWAPNLHILALPHPRLATLPQLDQAARSAGLIPTSHHTDAASALQQSGSLVCCGSFFIMAGLRQALGVDEPFDS
jgi:dihydrofolate synthase / folylpolyglutamate synthase